MNLVLYALRCKVQYLLLVVGVGVEPTQITSFKASFISLVHLAKQSHIPHRHPTIFKVLVFPSSQLMC